MQRTTQRLVVGLAAIVALFGGCDDPIEPVEPLSPADDLYDPSPYQPANNFCKAFSPPPSPFRATLTRAFGHLQNAGPLFNKATDLIEVGGGQWMLSALGGQVVGFGESTDQTQARVLLDISGRLDFGDRENGLVSIAVGPDFDETGWLFAVYSVPSEGGSRFVSRLGRFTARPDGTFDPDSEVAILDVPQIYGTHSMNQATFGADGMLYISLGDDLQNVHATNDPELIDSQELGSLKGKILRIDVRGEGPARYLIPEDNPFVDVEGASPEIYALGLRNPWRFSVEPDGRVFIGDVGQDTREEISFAEPGANLGWPYYEGRLCLILADCDRPGLTPPLADYTLGGPKSVVGGPVYVGRDVPGLEGRVLFGDHMLGHIWSVDPETGETQQEHEGEFPLTSFARAASGAVFALRFDTEGQGGIYELVPTVTTPEDIENPFPRLLSETGCFDPDDPRKVRPGVIPYEPVARLWSDASDKERFFAIPNDRRIAINDEGGFVFPEGTVLIKSFKFGAVYHETRLYMRTEAGWHGYSYRWNEDQTDAELLDTALSATLPGGLLWTWPSRSQCNLCHTEASGIVLGLEVGQLDHPLSDTLAAVLGEPVENQLEWLVEKDFMAPGHTDLVALRASMPRLVDPLPGDPEVSVEGSLDERARAYLHANCAMCHRPGGLGRGNIDLRIATPFSDTKLCNVDPDERVWGYNNWNDQRILSPGVPEDSTLYLRMLTPGFFRMPPLASELIHEDAGELLRLWIEGIEGCEDR